MTSINTGSTIEIPDEVTVIDDPEDAPFRAPATHNSYEHTHAFVMVLRYEDMASAGWYAELFTEAGEKPSESKLVSDEAEGWHEAIRLAKKHSLPLVSYSECIGY